MLFSKKQFKIQNLKVGLITTKVKSTYYKNFQQSHKKKILVSNIC